MKLKKGSEWNRWDLHIHTPLSILNNGFGQQTDETFDCYVKELFNKAVQKKIVAIGITDYFTIEGYKKIRKILSSEQDLERLFPDQHFRTKVQEILLLPNIEFRLDTFVGKNSSSVNYHVIFSEEFSPEEIETNFINVIKFKFDAHDERQLTRVNIENFGAKLKCEQNFSGSDYEVGLKHLTVSNKIIETILETSKIFKNKYITSIPIDEDLSDISWAGRDHSTRKILIKKSDFFFTSNPKTVQWALGKSSQSIDEYIAEFSKTKPCLHGSDAHCQEDLFNPAENRFCWIKAEPTFNGLLQVLYEPDTRVKIQEEIPEIKTPYNLIDYIEIVNQDMGDKSMPCRIQINPALNCIIGGKSTGKSLLLNNIANTIDPVQTKEKMNQDTQQVSDYFLPQSDIKVFWCDENSSDENRKIVYIPQGYLSTLSQNNEVKTYIDSIIESVLFQYPEIKQKHDNYIKENQNVQNEIKRLINQYATIEKQSILLLNLLKENNSSNTIKNEISRLNVEKEKNKTANVTPEEVTQFSILTQKIQMLTNEITQDAHDIEQLQKLEKLQLVFPFEVKLLNENLQNEISSIKEFITQSANSLWEESQKRLVKTLNIKLANIIKDKESAENELNKLKPKIETSKVLQGILQAIVIQDEKLKKAEDLEKELKETKTSITSLQNDLIKLTYSFLAISQTYANFINSFPELQKSELLYRVKCIFKETAFKSFIFAKVNRRTLTSFPNLRDENFKGTDFTPKFIEDFIKSLLSEEQASIQGKTGQTKIEILEAFLTNWYHLTYDIQLDSDTINYMSPGKKSLTLLKLLIELSDTDCPILLDQPEDDLDNRSIFNELVSYIKNKKQKRQIIIVSHNANIVVGADAEQIIIANQHGSDTPNRFYKFEYKAGAIENLECDKASNNVLDQFRIQEHICQILEGGETAFKRRKKKYYFLE